MAGSLNENDVAEAARQLDEADIERRQIGLLSLAYPDMTMDDAYAVQNALIARKLARGRKIIGWKIGLTSKAMQMALNIDIPDSGVLLDDMKFDDGAIIARDRFIQPRIEAEIAFIMGRPLTGDQISAADALAACAEIAPALEILDTRILRFDPVSKRPRIITDTISDNAANAGIVLGKQRFKPQDFDMRWIGAILSRNGEVEETGLGAGVLNDPALSVAWLANRLARYGGAIAAGDVILSGSFIRPVEAPPGSKIVADFGPFGSAHCEFAL